MPRYCKVFAVCLLPVIITLVACNRKPTVNPDLKALKLNGADGGKRVPLQIGQRVLIELPASPGTGYQWTIPEAQTTGIVVEHLPAKFTKSEQAMKSYWKAEGYRIFELVAQRQGQTEWSTEYRHPDNTKPTMYQFKVKFIVKEPES